MLRSTSQPTSGNTSGPLVRPPIVFACSLLCGLLFGWVWPVGFVPPRIGTPVGALLTAGAIVLFAFSVREFWRFETPVPSSRPTQALVKTGPYRWSRNPIYVAFTVFQTGVGIWTDSAWVLATLIPALALVAYGVVAREEKYLAMKFGEEYLRYKGSVRRWL